MEADYPPRWDGFKRRRMYLLYLYVSARSEWGIPARRLQMADAAVFAETVSGLFREAGVPERAAARIHEVCTRHLLGWRGGLNIFTGRWARRLFLFLSYILYFYILSAIFILSYPYYPLQPAGKLRRFRMCGINLRAVCIGGRPCRAAGTV